MIRNLNKRSVKSNTLDDIGLINNICLYVIGLINSPLH